jgi:hypothetical protein
MQIMGWLTCARRADLPVPFLKWMLAENPLEDGFTVGRIPDTGKHIKEARGKKNESLSKTP